jgi:DNA repair protein SbcD/Mre11
VKLLHTADWHIGKRLYGVDRSAESAAVLAEVREVAAAEAVDAVLVAGDLLDRRLVDPASLGACLAALGALADVAPVVAVTGNHDDPDLWDHLAPYLAPRGITVVGRVRGSAADAVLDVATGAGPLHVATLPWLETARLGLPAGADRRGARGTYADDVAGIVAVLADELRRRRAAEGGAAVLLGHLLVDGAAAGGGERELTLGIAYAVTAAAIPTDLDYLALGHAHRPQRVPRVPAAGRYAGSPLALDFSEDNHAKSVAVASIAADVTEVRDVRLGAGRRLARIRGPLDELPRLAAAHEDAYLYCEVELDRVAIDLVREVRDLLPGALRVEPRYPQPADDGAAAADRDGRAARSLPDHYADWHDALGRPLDQGQAEAFAAALAAAEGAPTTP